MRLSKLKHNVEQKNGVYLVKEETPRKADHITETQVFLEKRADNSYEVTLETVTFNPLIDVTDFDEVHEKNTEVFASFDEALHYVSQKTGLTFN